MWYITLATTSQGLRYKTGDSAGLQDYSKMNFLFAVPQETSLLLSAIPGLLFMKQ